MVKFSQLTEFSIGQRFSKNFYYLSQYHPISVLTEEGGAILNTSYDYSIVNPHVRIF